jgi:hypothetical protein
MKKSRIIMASGLLAGLWTYAAWPRAKRLTASFAHLVVVETPYIPLEELRPLMLEERRSAVRRRPPRRPPSPLRHRIPPEVPIPESLPPPEPPLPRAEDLAPPSPDILPVVPLTPDRVTPPAPTEPPSRSSPDPRAVGRGIEIELLERDRRVGIDSGGGQRVATALAVAARRHTPAVASGSFVALVGSDGAVSSIQLLGFDAGEAGDWRRAAEAARAALASMRLRRRHLLAGGARVVVHVTSNLEMPSGSGRTKRLPPVGRDRLPKAGRGWPWLPDPGRPRLSWREEGDFGRPPEPGQPCLRSPSCQGLVCGSFDVADIGARPTRVVRTRVEVLPIESTLGPRIEPDGG